MLRFVRFFDGRENQYGVLEGEEIRAISGSVFGSWQPAGRAYQLSEVKLLAPCEPSKIVCIGLNYRDHAAEVKAELPKAPLLFMKPSTAVIGPEDTIIKPEMCRRLDYEAELSVVIGRTARHLPAGEAANYILGYTCGNDVTARDLQPKDGQWTLAKSFDTFCPLGPWIVPGIDPSNLEIKLFLNGEQKQRSTTAQLVFNVPELVSYISQVMTLLPGDVIMTGTPSGIAPMVPGDEVVVEIQSIGRLLNRVAAPGA